MKNKHNAAAPSSYEQTMPQLLRIKLGLILAQSGGDLRGLSVYRPSANNPRFGKNIIGVSIKWTLFETETKKPHYYFKQFYFAGKLMYLEKFVLNNFIPEIQAKRAKLEGNNEN